MMMRWLPTLALLLWASPVAALGPVTGLGAQHTASSTTGVLTTTADCPPGSLIAFGVAYSTVADTLSSATDSAGNTYATPFDNIAGTNIGVGWTYAANIHADLPLGGTITATFAGATVSTIAAACVPGVASVPLDISGKSATGASATAATTTNTGTLSQPKEVIFGVVGGAVPVGVNACGGSFARPANSSGTPSIFLCSQIVNAISSVAFSPTWTNVSNYADDMITFKGAKPGGGSLTLLGVGP